MPECRDQNRFNGDLERNINISTIYGNYIMVLISISSYYVRLSTLIFSVFDLFSFMSYKQYNPSLCNTETVLHPTVVGFNHQSSALNLEALILIYSNINEHLSIK